MEIPAFRQQVAQDWTGHDTAAAWQKHFPQMREQMAAVANALVESRRHSLKLRRVRKSPGRSRRRVSRVNRPADCLACSTCCTILGAVSLHGGTA
jgi:hypothetical protein